MYVKRSPSMPRNFPANYKGNLITNESRVQIKNDDKPSEIEKIIQKHYLVKKNKFHSKERKNLKQNFIDFSNDDILLLGLLVFLYVGCEHSKDNLIIMGVIAYLLFYGK